MSFTQADADARRERTGVRHVVVTDKLLPVTHQSASHIGFIHFEASGVTWVVWDSSGEFVVSGSHMVDDETSWITCARTALIEFRARELYRVS